MSFSKDGNSDPTSESVEQEDKVNVEEASVNLGYVKTELNEGELAFEDNQYKIALTFENLFGQSSTEQQKRNRDSLLGFLDGDVIMKTETGTIKLEDVKEESKDLIRKTMEQSDCNKCGGNYQGYCLNCSSLSHILNNLTPNLNPEPVLNATPLNMLEIREVSRGCAVFASKTLPKGIILGPFEGIAPIESTTGLQWKIKDKKLVNDQNGNWMKYIQSVANPSSRNLDVFQFDGILYFETCREIQEGEELLVCYHGDKEELLKSDKAEEFYLVPLKKEEYPNVFACTLCCLGFRLESCLVEHKNKCSHEVNIEDFEIALDYFKTCVESCLVEHKSKCPHGVNIEDFEITQCRCCKVWLEKEEYLENHMVHCRENYNRSCRNRNNTDYEEQVHEKDEITSIDVNASHSTLPTETIHLKNCFYRTQIRKDEYFHDKNMGTTHSNSNNLKSHLGRHTGIKRFQCDICKQRFGHKNSLNSHIKYNHSNTIEKDYKCFECSFQTSRKGDLKRHLGTHSDIKHFQCHICKQRFAQKGHLNVHIKDKHSNINEKEYNCSACSFQTNHKGNFKTHLGTHSDIKLFQCDVCKQRFGRKSSLKLHIKMKHLNINEKEYKCSECSYQTNCKSHLKIHLVSHTGIKNFQCDICKQRFGHKSHLNVHIRNQHSNTNEKEYKCSECSYQTNYKANLKVHLGTHTGIKHFQCDICKQRFTQNGTLKRHIKDKHSNTNEKEFKCSECSYQTNWKAHLKHHMGTVHSNTNKKEYKCAECSYQTNWSRDLKHHMGTVHSNTSEKEYKCSECCYQTNHKGSLKVHLDTHTGIKGFECAVCKQRFAQKGNLKRHIKNKHRQGNLKIYMGVHSNTNEMEYKCSEFSYQTNVKGNLKIHLDTHTGDKQHFQCDICKQRFGQNSYLKRHIKNKHSNTN